MIIGDGSLFSSSRSQTFAPDFGPNKGLDQPVQTGRERTRKGSGVSGGKVAKTLIISFALKRLGLGQGGTTVGKDTPLSKTLPRQALHNWQASSYGPGGSHEQQRLVWLYPVSS